MARKKDPERETARRNEMMAVCFQLLSTRSHEAMTLEAVAEALGGSKGQIAHYFSTKEALIAATMRAALELHGQALLAVAEQEGTLEERLRMLIALALPDGPELKARLAFVAEVWSFAKTSAETREAVRATYTSMHAVTRRLLDIGIAEGFVTAKHAERTLVPIAALFDGMVLHAAYSDLDVGELRKQTEETLGLLLGLDPGRGRKGRSNGKARRRL